MGISEEEFSRICRSIRDDRDSIVRHNPIGTDEEILLWMLLSFLILYLNLTELETPCFSGRPDASTYRNAIEFVMKDRREGNFEIRAYLDNLIAE